MPIVKRGNLYCITNTNVCHETYKEALRQLRAIQIQKSSGSEICTTSLENEHRHTVMAGESQTSMEHGHSHEVLSDGSLSVENGHSHELICGPSMDEDRVVTNV